MAEPGQRIEAIVGEPVTVRLGAGPPTGYAWHARELAGIRVLDAPSTPGDPGQGRAPGDPVEEQLVLIADTRHPSVGPRAGPAVGA